MEEPHQLLLLMTALLPQLASGFTAESSCLIHHHLASSRVPHACAMVQPSGDSTDGPSENKGLTVRRPAPQTSVVPADNKDLMSVVPAENKALMSVVDEKLVARAKELGSALVEKIEAGFDIVTNALAICLALGLLLNIAGFGYRLDASKGVVIRPLSDMREVNAEKQFIRSAAEVEF